MALLFTFTLKVFLHTPTENKCPILLSPSASKIVIYLSEIVSLGSRKTLSEYSGSFALISLELPGDTISRKLTVMSTSSPAAIIAESKLIPSTSMFALAIFTDKTNKAINKNILIVFLILIASKNLFLRG